MSDLSPAERVAAGKADAGAPPLPDLPGVEYPRLALVLELGPGDAGRVEVALPDTASDIGDRLKAAGADGLNLLAEAAMEAQGHLLDHLHLLEPADPPPSLFDLQAPDAAP